MKKLNNQSLICKITFTSILLMIFYFIISLYPTEALDQETTKVITFSGALPLDRIEIDNNQLNDMKGSGKNFKGTATLFLNDDDNTQIEIPLKLKIKAKNNGTLKYNLKTNAGFTRKFKMKMKTRGTPEQIQKYKIKFDRKKMNPSGVTIKTDNDGDGDDGDDGITVTSPKGGDVWNIGTTQQITWTSNEVTGNVDVLIYKGGNDTGWGFFDKENTGSISWTVTNDFAVGSDCSIKIVSIENNSISGESGLFTISSGGTDPYPDIPQNLIGLTLILTQNNGYETQYYFRTNKNGLMKDQLGVSTDIIYAYYFTGAEIQNENEAIISYSYAFGKRYDAKILLTYENSTFGMYTKTDESKYGYIKTTGKFNLYNNQ